MFAKTFRNTLIASTLVVAGSVLANPAMAADNDSGSITLGGTVDPVTTLTISAPVGDLDLHGENTTQAATVVKAADLAIFTNNAEGVTLTATGGSLTSVDGGTLAYTVLIVADAASAPEATAITATEDTEAVTVDANGAASRDLYMQYNSPLVLDPGVYTGSISVTITNL